MYSIRRVEIIVREIDRQTHRHTDKMSNAPVKKRLASLGQTNAP